MHFQFLADNEHDKKIERNVQELRAALKIGLEQIIGQLPCLKVEYEENKAIKALRDELKVQKEEMTKFKIKGTFQEEVIKELEGKLAGFQRDLNDAKDTGKDSAAKDAEIAELKEELALLQNELGNTKAALDMEDYELKTDREMRVKDQQMLAEKDKVTEYLKGLLKAAEEKDRESLANIMEAQMVYIYIYIYMHVSIVHTLYAHIHNIYINTLYMCL